MDNSRRIVSIRVGGGRNKCRVVFDTGEETVLAMDIVLKYALSKGVAINEDMFSEINRNNDLINAKQTAYNFATYAKRTEKQIIDKMKRSGYTEEIFPEVINFLKSFNLIDDYAFAVGYVGACLKKKAIGAQKIKMALISKGVSKELADRALEEAFPHEDSGDIAMAALEKKLRSMPAKKTEDKRKLKASLFAYMVNRGFDYDLAIRKIDEILE